jgi:hypothetical protein
VASREGAIQHKLLTNKVISRAEALLMAKRKGSRDIPERPEMSGSRVQYSAAAIDQQLSFFASRAREPRFFNTRSEGATFRPPFPINFA